MFYPGQLSGQGNSTVIYIGREKVYGESSLQTPTVRLAPKSSNELTKAKANSGVMRMDQMLTEKL